MTTFPRNTGRDEHGTITPILSVYLAGKMSGIPLWNFPAFTEACAELRGRGYTVFSPHEHDLEEGFRPERTSFSPTERASSMRWDVERIFEVDAVVVLPGWEKGRGATAEASLARFLDKPVLLYPTLELLQNVSQVIQSEDETPDPNPSVLQEAQRIIHGARRRDYGPAEESFIKIAKGWSIIFGHEVTSTDVALAMCWLKICRFLNSQDRDSLVDLAGYTGLAAQIEGID